MSTMGIVAPINKDEMKELLKETKETLAIDTVKNGDQHLAFGAIDLWKVRKNHRSMFSMRRRFN